jgi:hypothetical protein
VRRAALRVAARPTGWRSFLVANQSALFLGYVKDFVKKIG